MSIYERNYFKAWKSYFNSKNWRKVFGWGRKAFGLNLLRKWQNRQNVLSSKPLNSSGYLFTSNVDDKQSLAFLAKQFS